MKDKEILHRISENIRIKRLKKKFTQEKLAELSGITQKYISLIEKQKANPSIVIIVKIAEALNTDLNLLIKEVED